MILGIADLPERAFFRAASNRNVKHWHDLANDANLEDGVIKDDALDSFQANAPSEIRNVIITGNWTKNAPKSGTGKQPLRDTGKLVKSAEARRK